MEGAAIAHACRESGVPMIQVRSVSNRTGDRDRAGWDLETAAASVQDVLERALRESVRKSLAQVTQSDAVVP